jgi:hypothetical protein
MPAWQPQHLTLDALLRWTESLPAEHLADYHHLLGCRACRHRARRLLPEIAPEAVPPRAPLVSRLYESVFQRLEKRLSEPRETFAIGPEEADAEIERLLGAPLRRRRQIFREKDAAHAIPIVLRLLERAYEVSYPYPTRGRDLAAHAFQFACELGRAGVSAATEAELKVRARVVEGYAAALAVRPQSEYDFHFENAEREITHPDAVEAAVFCHLRGSVRAHERRNAEALALLERAARLYGETGEVLEEALALFEQAWVYARLGDGDRALALFGRAVALKRDWTPPADALREQLLLALMHAAAGHPHVAREVLAAAETQAAEAGLPQPPLHALAHARLAAAAGDRAETERRLAEALRSALAAGACGEAAAAAFHLAILDADAGDLDAMAALAGAMAPILAPGTMPTHLRDALRAVRDLLQAGDVTPGRLTGLLRRFRERAPGAVGPFRGLTVLFDAAMTAPLLGSRTKLLPFAERTERHGGSRQGEF